VPEDSIQNTQENLNENQLEEKAESQKIINEATLIAQQQAKTILAKIQTQYLGGEKENQPVRVQQMQRAFLYTAHESQPKMLRAGQHQISTLVVSEKDNIHSDKARLHEFACVCTVSDRPIRTSIILPDANYLRQYGEFPEGVSEQNSALVDLSGVQRAISGVGIRTSDNYLGTVRMQLELTPGDPSKLIEELKNAQDDRNPNASKLEAYEQEFKKQIDRKDKTGEQVKVTASRGGTIGKILDFMGGKKSLIDGRLLEPVKKVSFADLYPQLRFELMRVVATAVRNYAAEDLYDRLETRTNVEQDIKEHMGQTLDFFGLELTRVSAFEFHSLNYEKKLNIREKVSLERDLNEEKQSYYDGQKQSRRLDSDDTKDQMAVQGEIDRAKIEQNILNDAEQQKLLDQQHQARLAQEGLTHQAKEQKRLESAQTDSKIMREEIATQREALELYREKLAIKAHFEQERVKMLSDIPADKLLPIIADRNPALKQALIAAQQADSAEARIEAERRLAQEISSIQSINQQNQWELMKVAAEQIGHVTGKLVSPSQSEPKQLKAPEDKE